jgi:hypothetical protein
MQQDDGIVVPGRALTTTGLGVVTGQGVEGRHEPTVVRLVRLPYRLARLQLVAHAAHLPITPLSVTFEDPPGGPAVAPIGLLTQ